MALKYETEQLSYSFCIEVRSGDKGDEWMKTLASVLGEASFITTPESHAGTQDETAVYYFPRNAKDNPSITATRNTTLIIKRSRTGFNSDFRVYGTVVENGRQLRYECQNVSSIQVDESKGCVRFVNAGDKHFPSEYTGIIVSKTGAIDWSR